jgi:hypothetical protein
MKKRRNSAGELDAKCDKAKEALLSLIAIGLPAMADTFPVSGIVHIGTSIHVTLV